MRMEELLSKELPLYAHIGRGYNETVSEHSELVMQFCKQLKEDNGLGKAVERTIKALTHREEVLSAEEHKLIESWFYSAIYLHDLGKVNPAFQKVKMKNKRVVVEKEMSTHHSLLSSLLYLEIYEQEVLAFTKDDDKISFLLYILFVFSYIISRHHTYLEDLSLEEYRERLSLLANKLKKKPSYLQYYQRGSSVLKEFDLSNFIGDYSLDYESHNDFPLYVLTRLLYSAMVASDFYATYTYDKRGQKPKFRYLEKEDVLELRCIYDQTKVIKGINAYKENDSYFNDAPINKLRSEMFIEAEQELLKNVDECLFYLEAPTGSGKTNMSINLALTLLEKSESLNKVLYIFPFNTLVEQTKHVFDEIFPEEVQQRFPISVINSVTPIIQDHEKTNMEHVEDGTKTGETFFDYKEEVLYRQMLQYPISITSHVNFFNYLFGTGRESNLTFAHLCNSIIIIDEIQSYKNARWLEIIQFFNQFAGLLNMKIIIMSATLPKLDRLLKENKQTVDLLPNAKSFFASPLFKERVKLHFDLVDEGKIKCESLMEKVLDIRKRYGKKRILVECIKRRDAETLYQLLVEELEQYDEQIPIALLTGSNHAYYRKKVIDQLGKDKDGTFKLDDIIVVTTQVIEAGVDIDMDIGLKDISTLDSEEQFLGRINRSCLRRDCHAFFFHMSDAEEVYRGDYRLEFDLRTLEYRQFLEGKQFEAFYEHVFRQIEYTRGELNENHIGHFYNMVRDLEFGKVAKHMQLIEEQKYQVYIAHDIELDNGKVLCGQVVWDEFLTLLNDRDMEFSKKRVEQSIIAEKMSYFLYSVYQDPPVCDKKVGTIYYIENGEAFIEKDEFTGLKVFSEKKLKELSEEMFL